MIVQIIKRDKIVWTTKSCVIFLKEIKIQISIPSSIPKIGIIKIAQYILNSFITYERE
jgi:hypothetical protein